MKRTLVIGIATIRPGKRAFRALVIVCLSAANGYLLWSFLPYAPMRTATPAISSPAAPTFSAPSQVGDRIAAAHLFGRDISTPGPAIPVAANIVIEGIIYSDDKDLAQVIIDTGGKSDFFKIGDTLPDGEKISDIGINDIQIADGQATRTIAMEHLYSNDVNVGIQITGAEGMPLLSNLVSSGPNTSRPTGPLPAPALRAAVIPNTSDPIAQLQVLRQQLIH